MLFRFLSGDFPLTIMFMLVLGVFARRHWSGVRSYWTERDPFWRIVGRATLLLTVILPLWVALFDNWRQLLGYSLSASSRYKSDVFDTSPTPDAIRVITLVMIAVSLVGVALIYSRRQHGIAMLSVIFVFAAAYFYFMNGLRMRADVFLATTRDSLSHPSILDLSFILFWSIGMYTVICSVIAAAYAWLFSVLTIPMHIIYGIATRNKSAVDPESLIVYHRLSPLSSDRKRVDRHDDHEGSPPIDSKSVAH